MPVKKDSGKVYKITASHLTLAAVIIVAFAFFSSMQSREALLAAPELTICGNGVCESGETAERCCIDCGCTAGICRAANGKYTCEKELSFDSQLILLILMNLSIIAAIILLSFYLKTKKSRVYLHLKRLIKETESYILAEDANGAIKEYNSLKEAFQSSKGKLSGKQSREIYKESVALHKRVVKLHKKSKERSLSFGV